MLNQECDDLANDEEPPTESPPTAPPTAATTAINTTTPRPSPRQLNYVIEATEELAAVTKLLSKAKRR
eukprot:1508255-Pyramimonas_sp.AAC.1